VYLCASKSFPGAYEKACDENERRWKMMGAFKRITRWSFTVTEYCYGLLYMQSLKVRIVIGEIRLSQMVS